jgi:hypothetical protein
MDIKQDHQELSQTKPYHPKLAHNIIHRKLWWTMYMREAFPTTMLMIQMYASLKYKDVYTSWYICNAKCKNTQRKAIHMLQRSSYHQLRKPNTYQVFPANEWKLLDLGAWWKYPIVGFVWVHESKQFSLSQHCLSKNGIPLIYPWFLNEELGSLQH